MIRRIPIPPREIAQVTLVGDLRETHALCVQGTHARIERKSRHRKLAWHYQFTPHDAWDYDGVNVLLLTDLAIGGKKTPVMMQANRNGFFYVIDRSNGKLLSANKFVEVNWATGTDMKTGKPIETAGNAKRPRMKARAMNVCPNLLGGKNWMPMSYNPQTGLVYIPTLNLCIDMEGVNPEYKRGPFYLAVDFDLGKAGPGGFMGGVKPGIRSRKSRSGSTRIRCPTPAARCRPRAGSCSTAT